MKTKLFYVLIIILLYFTSNFSCQETMVTTTPTSIQMNLTLADTNFSDEQLNLKATPSLIPALQNLTSTNADSCILRLKNLLASMSDAEQVAFYNAYVSVKMNPTASENSGRCFSPGQLKRLFKQISTGNAKQFSANLTKQSKSIKGSFSCLKKSLKSLKSNSSIETPVNDFVNAQANANQCLSIFLKTLFQTLKARRRYLLLSLNDLSSTGLTQDKFNITGFPYLTTEVEQISKAFINFANCYQAMPDSLTKSFSDALAIVADDPNCASTTTSARILQSATINGTILISAPGDISMAIPNTTLPLIQMNNTNQTGPGGKRGKTKSAASIVLSDTQLAVINAIITNYQTKSDNYLIVANNLKTIKSSTDLKSKCNLPAQFNSFLQNPSNNTASILNIELSKQRKNTQCTKADYLILLQKQASSSTGTLSGCNDAETACTNESNVAFKNSDNTEIIVAFGCSAGTRFSYAYTSNAKLGNFFDFKTSSIKTCKRGESANCAKKLAQMKATLLMRFLADEKNADAAGNNCVPKMQKGCSDTLNKECQNTGLMNFVASNAPSETDNPLPDACNNIDPLNPDYTNCFNWINNNLIRFTLFANVENIKNLPAVINSSQSITVTSLRYMQTSSSSSVQIVTEDPSTKDSTAQIGSDLYIVNDADLTIDGANPALISSDAYSTTAIIGDSNSLSYLKTSFLINFVVCFVLLLV